MKKDFFIAAMFLLPLFWEGPGMGLKAQSFTPDVIGSAGTFATSASGSMSWTIGEVFTETYSAAPPPASNFFTQGFHQPEPFVVSVFNYSSSENVSIYPNPVVDHLIIDLSGAAGNHSVFIYDMLGQLLMQEFISANEKQLNISFRSYADGIYLLNIIHSESNTGNSYKINKTEYK